MGKYIIELDENAKEVVVISLEDGDMWTGTMEVEDLEQLNSDYINEHFGDLQDTAYQRGLEDGKKATWEAVRKVIHLPEGVVLDLFTDCYSSVCTVLQVFLKYEGSEVIEKLKAYEKKQSDKIKVGDEVVSKHSGIKGILLEPETEHLLATVIIPSQRWRTIYDAHVNLKKTGKHYDIEKLLEAMKHD